MKKILGLDLGTNSIGWSIIKQDFDKKEGEILGMGTRIIPMSKDVMDKFGSGQSISQTAERTDYRGIRRLNERHLLRRERLHRVLNVINFLPEHYANAIDFVKRKGQFNPETEVKLSFKTNENDKHEFLFQDAFNEMVDVFKANGHDIKLPYDWTLYYIRTKALTKKISKEELAWIILNFNQKRGYYQLRGEEEQDNNKNEEFYALKVIAVEDSGDTNAKGTWYNVILENDWIYRRQSKEPLSSWIGKIKEFIVTTTLEKDGTLKKDKEGNVKRSFRAVDSEKDWIAIKKKTEQDIKKSNKTVGEFIFDSLLINTKQKIKGSLVKTIERKYYKDELLKILETQKQFHPELQSKTLYQDAINELYQKNKAHQNNIKDRDFTYLFIDDIIFYQRPLKSKKSTISDCPYESRAYKKNCEIITVPIKCISKSNPLFQEFRLWQFVSNLKIYQCELIENDKTQIDVDITSNVFITESDYEDLFKFLNTKKDVEQKHIIEYLVKLKKISKSEKDNYRWNYVEDRKYPANSTRSQFLSRLKKIDGCDAEQFLTKTIEHQLWHIVYSVKDKVQFKNALEKFAIKHRLNQDSFVENFEKFPPFANDYGAYSEKAIKKLLPLMRLGTYWNDELISKDVSERLQSIKERLETINHDKEKIETVADDEVQKQLLKSFIKLKGKPFNKGLNTHQACYAVYERHSEIGSVLHWNVPNDIDKFLQEFRQHSLRNPIVEQVVTETLRVVRDIWSFYGKGENNFFDEIHIELGRELKNPAEKRKQITARQNENENTNSRIKSILNELKQEGVKDVKPYSPSQQEILKIYEEGIFQNSKVDYSKVSEDEIVKIRKSASPTKSEITKYRLWLEQGYISPYSGKPIPLSKLFTTDYQIEHIIPQSRYFDNSLGNKVICESRINEKKSNQTAYEFIKQQGGSLIDGIPVLKLENYEAHCNIYFKKNRAKLKNLLSEDVPEGFINRQLNDSRYISKFIKTLLSNIVREEGENQATSKHIVTINGAITSRLKNDWGLNDKWNEIVAPRFERLNTITNSQDFGYWDKSINAFRTQVPDELSKGFSKKRIDHRHHALDALVIACTTKDHVNYITSLNTERKNFALVDKLRHTEEKQIKDKTGVLKTITVAKAYKHPWKDFTINAKTALEKIVISFKQNLRVINKTNNKTWQWVEEKGQLKKKLVKQTKGDSWAIRKPMHDPMPYGLSRLNFEVLDIVKELGKYESIENEFIKKQVKEVLISCDSKIGDAKKLLKNKPIKNEYGFEVSKTRFIIKNEKYGKRQPILNISYPSLNALISKIEKNGLENSENEIIKAVIDTQKRIWKIGDLQIQKDCEKHLYENMQKGLFSIALFSVEGIENFNLNRIKENKPPIKSVKFVESGSKRFKLGEKISNNHKMMEATEGNNLFFAIYYDKDKDKRAYETIPLNEVIAHQKQTAYLPKKERLPIPIKAEKGRFLFSLSPNDLVYVPTDEEIDNPNLVDFDSLTPEQLKRIYTMVSTTQNKLHCRPLSFSNFLNEKEVGSSNKSERILKYYDERIDVVDDKHDPVMIKDRCWKLKINRLGKIIQVIKP